MKVSALPTWAKSPAEQLSAAGFSPLQIIALLLQYGPKIGELLQQIIDSFKVLPPAPVQSCDCDHANAMLEALVLALSCNTALRYGEAGESVFDDLQYHLVDALYHNSALQHE